ncbi:DegT/DnrJ/EryC1/StrS family aminotransferase [Cloacibacillus evryensis]|uniref:DegT/DnrJ/EryC1/StrS family aminotransferase n=1 Tax=Cloacibacillus evryensis TaxID=508460 RepID=UPI00210F178A|nr:DegT/DnrJ/EryC1/StrS family aminotransferase [Cloacibacillus evryensis]MCQ4764178.1 DegT/DnrJ/EryC1/StrS family aminotransferase [Cloacibacillus evryensis]MEA5035625.1 DegT/DnrJ/EryC1/StrS family aminotransferase [Cloacibacillus evryensis]
MAIQLFVPTFDVEGCLAEIRECLEKGWTGLGYKTVQFEEEWKKYTGLPYAHFLNSATVGLNLAFEILKEKYGWNDGDEVITTPLTFISSNHAILLNNLHAEFADIDDTLCLDPAEVEKHITPQTRAVLFVGVGGNVGHLDQIVNICKEHNLKLILDAAHMSGTRLNGECPAKYADVAVFSFQAVKNLPTADSGMICFREKELDEVVRKKTWLGINKDTYLRSSDNGTYKWKYDVEYVGYKYHGNSIMAAIALAQIKHLDKDNAYRRQIAKWYTDGFAPHSDKIKLVHVPGNCESSRHLFQILVENRDDLMTYLNKHDIYPGVHYVDNTEYRMYSYAKGECINAAYASEHLISLPLHMRLEFEDVQTVIKNVVVFITNEK